MDIGDGTEDVSGEVALGFDDVLDEVAFENEACGICMDIVIDRGVLDCCSHWFCFACIDNWAIITNLCPVCKKQFQLITCLPVYDTIGNVKVDEHLLSRDDDWYIQGKNNTLSFPSYYINEDAVICLDGDGCKLRNKLSMEEDLNLDTSIACDSCDIWYHAFCVGFDPECALENSWLCPRCTDHETPQQVDKISEQNLDNHHDPRNAGSGQSVDSAFSGKVSISIADAGETAIVVSMVEGKQLTKSAESDQAESELNTTMCIKMEALTPNIDTYNTDFEQGRDRDCVGEGDDGKLAENAAVNRCDSGFPLDLPSERTIITSNNLVQESLSGSLSFVQVLSDGTDVHPNDAKLGTSFPPSLSEGGTSVYDVTEAKVFGENDQESKEVFSLSVGKLIENGDENVAPLLDCKNIETNGSITSHTDILGLPLKNDAYTSYQQKKRERDLNAKAGTICAKRGKLDGRCHVVPQTCQIDASVAINPKGCSGVTSTSMDSESIHASGKDDHTPDIMCIVQDSCRLSNRRLSAERISEKSSDERQSGIGLRVKKILWKVSDDKESALLVQKLRNEIRETISNKELSDLSKHGAFDGKLLSAFRAAIAGPREKTVSKVDPSVVRGKRSLLQKGKVRENLTKKIYGTTSGRRRRAWDREWEIEFWKHRCTSSKPEKLETLQSVLDLLKQIKSPSMNSETEERTEREAADSILSRVYLADSSVLPRNDDIKPLSALTGPFMVNNLKLQKQDKFSPSLDQNLSSNTARTLGEISSNYSQGVVTSHDKRVKIDESSFKAETSFMKEQPNRLKMGVNPHVCPSRTANEGEKILKEPSSNSGSDRSDKRKWALEVLARKNAAINNDMSQREEDNLLLKGSYPLLSQLPMEMRPVPASTLNKVPMPARQAQLYRVTEHYLRRANVPVICRTADVELAVADAVNMEKEICERSKSKLVYMNLCSQHIMHSKGSNEVIVASYPTMGPTQGTEQVSNEAEMCAASGHGNVEEALRQAGLLSDSPPDSPPQSAKFFDEEANAVAGGEENFIKLVDINSRLDLENSGDIGYDLDDEGCGGHSRMSNSLGESKLQTENEESKMKAVPSAVSCELAIRSLDPRSDSASSSGKEKAANDLDMLRTVEAVSSTLPKHPHDKDFCKSALKMMNDISYPVTVSLEGKRYEELPSQVCEELHCPEKEPPKKMIYTEAMEITGGDITFADNENDRFNDEATVSGGKYGSCNEHIPAGSRLCVNYESSERENSPSRSLPSEHVGTEKTSTMNIGSNEQSEMGNAVSKKVEAYIKEHIRPLCKSGVITIKQYRWAVGKATEKVMKYHSKASSASFLVKEGGKVKKLAEEYVEASQRKQWEHKLHS